ncbi:hypothetical protein PI124_g18359 [Phytophthora idaei]|nr:hypothetical protein PI125_g16336 [Phytophthora idaei]KAG3236636.1 hypothetical protein PI124_g18359 [Phytophthora idaei]
MRDKLRPVLVAVKAKHPSLCVNVSLFGREGDKFNRIDTLTLDWRPKESNRKNELFFDYVEEEPERETYLDAARYEIENQGDADEEEEGDIEMEDLLLYRAMMARFIFGHDEDD